MVWGYRNNTKPTGVNPNHKGDIFLVFKDKNNKPNIEGVSLKAGGEKTAEPQFNSYVMVSFFTIINVSKSNFYITRLNFF